MKGEQNKILHVLEVKTTAVGKAYIFQIDVCSLDGSKFKNIAEKLQLKPPLNTWCKDMLLQWNKSIIKHG